MSGLEWFLFGLVDGIFCINLVWVGNPLPVEIHTSRITLSHSAPVPSCHTLVIQSVWDSECV